VLTEALIERVGPREVADEPSTFLPTGLARLVELARALATGPRLAPDEPASGLDDAETATGRSLAGAAPEETSPSSC